MDHYDELLQEAMSNLDSDRTLPWDNMGKSVSQKVLEKVFIDQEKKYYSAWVSLVYRNLFLTRGTSFKHVTALK